MFVDHDHMKRYLKAVFEKTFGFSPALTNINITKAHDSSHVEFSIGESSYIYNGCDILIVKTAAGKVRRKLTFDLQEKE